MTESAYQVVRKKGRMSSQIINKNIIYGIFAIIYYELTRHIIRKNISVKYIVLLIRKSLERSGNLRIIAKMLIQFTTTVIFGHYPCNFQETLQSKF